MQSIKVWDGFIRSFHWLLVINIAVLYFSIDEGMIELHFVAGFFAIALIVTRLVWGLVGSKTAKLSALLHSPIAVLKEFKNPSKGVGHSAPGSYMVLLFFVLIIVQLVTGLMSMCRAQRLILQIGCTALISIFYFMPFACMLLPLLCIK